VGHSLKHPWRLILCCTREFSDGLMGSQNLQTTALSWRAVRSVAERKLPQTQLTPGVMWCPQLSHGVRTDTCVIPLVSFGATQPASAGCGRMLTLQILRMWLQCLFLWSRLHIQATCLFLQFQVAVYTEFYNLSVENTAHDQRLSLPSRAPSLAIDYKGFSAKTTLNSADSARHTAECIQWCYSYSMLQWQLLHAVTCKSDKLDYARQVYKKLGSSEHVGEAVEAGKVNHSCYFHAFPSGTSIIYRIQ